jgi:hypothetical protein
MAVPHLVRQAIAAGSLGPVELPSLRAVIGGALALAIAAGFLFELSWVFLGGLVLFLAWCGYLLLAPDES